MDVLRLAGDALWIAALVIMAAASRTAQARLVPGARAPLIVGPGGRPWLRAPAKAVIWLIPGAAFVAGLVLTAIHSRAPDGAQWGLIVFGLRATGAALLALAHLQWLRGAMTVLAREGALKP